MMMRTKCWTRSQGSIKSSCATPLDTTPPASRSGDEIELEGGGRTELWTRVDQTHLVNQHFTSTPHIIVLIIIDNGGEHAERRRCYVGLCEEGRARGIRLACCLRRPNASERRSPLDA